MEFNFIAIAVAAIVPLFLGFIWYNPKVFGIAWMRAAEMTEEKMKNANMAVIFGVSLLLSLILAFFLQFSVIHQTGVMGLIGGDPSMAKASYEAFMADYGGVYRSFGHGALHGALVGFTTALPVLAINALFERKGFKYILVNCGYWIVCLAIMGAILCGWQ